MQEDFKEAEDAGVVDLDPRIANRADERGLLDRAL
jgi:hypothetical protein